MILKINGKNLKSLGIFNTMMTVPDCFVVRSNKIGTAHGEAKFYIASKSDMYDFYGKEKFKINCFMLKTDLLSYLFAIKNEYFNPSQNYFGKNDLPKLWNERLALVNKLDDIIYFSVNDQYQIKGPRGYVNSNDEPYQLLRQLALPLVSYIYVEKLGDEKSPLFYWKLFVDFELIWQKQSDPLVFTYGKKKTDKLSKKDVQSTFSEKEKKITKVRKGQDKYREKLLEQCHYCPFTKISDERLLIASHIKPWAASNDKEKIDPYNGFALSPLYDKLFDKGFITFTSNKHVILSEFISSYTWKLIGLKQDAFIKELPMDEKRIEYLKFHHHSVFKGYFDFDE